MKNKVIGSSPTTLQNRLFPEEANNSSIDDSLVKHSRPRKSGTLHLGAAETARQQRSKAGGSNRPRDEAARLSSRVKIHVPRSSRCLHVRGPVLKVMRAASDSGQREWRALRRELHREELSLALDGIYWQCAPGRCV